MFFSNFLNPFLLIVHLKSFCQVNKSLKQISLKNHCHEQYSFSLLSNLLYASSKECLCVNLSRAMTYSNICQVKNKEQITFPLILIPFTKCWVPWNVHSLMIFNWKCSFIVSLFYQVRVVSFMREIWYLKCLCTISI